MFARPRGQYASTGSGRDGSVGPAACRVRWRLAADRAYNDVEPVTTAPVEKPTVSIQAPPAPDALAIGDTALVFNTSSGRQEGSAQILAIETDPACSAQWKDQTGYDPSGVTPHRIAVQMLVKADNNTINPSEFNIREVLPDGTVATKDAHGAYGSICLKDRPTVYSVDIGTTQRGWVLFGVQNPIGKLLWKNSNGGPGYALAYPQDPPPPPPSSSTPRSTTTTPPTTRAQATTAAPTTQGCPPGTVFSPMGLDSCVTPQQKAKTENLEGQCGGGNGPVSVCGPKPTPAPKASNTAGCAARAMAAGKFDPSCPEYQGYLDPGGPGRGPTSGDLQHQNGCQQGYIPRSQC